MRRALEIRRRIMGRAYAGNAGREDTERQRQGRQLGAPLSALPQKESGV